MFKVSFLRFFIGCHYIIAQANSELDSKGNDIYMTRYQTADFLSVDISTVHNWTKKGLLKSYGIGYRRYYNKKEIIDYLLEHQLS